MPPMPPPKLTVGTEVRRDSGSAAGAGCPVDGCGLVAPSPIAYSVSVSPACAGCVLTPGNEPTGIGMLPSWFTIAPYVPTPINNSRGARAATSTDTLLLNCPSRETCTSAAPEGTPYGIWNASCP